jgi:ankyrin repeat protein
MTVPRRCAIVKDKQHAWSVPTGIEGSGFVAIADREPVPGPEMLRFAAKVFNLARQGDTGTLAAYVEAGVPANLCNDKGDTLVMLAAYHGHPQTVSVLLEHGADSDRTNDRGQTPLAGAVFKGERAVIEALLDGGADPSAGSPSAVETARMFGLDDLIALFEGR